MTGLLRSAWAELLVLRHSPGMWALVLLLPALTLLNEYLVQYVFYRTADTGTVSDLGSPLQLLYTLSPNQMVTVVTASYATAGAAVAVVLGALVAGGDWGRGTMKTALAQGPGRVATAVGQALAVLIALTVSVGLNFGLAALVSRLIMTIEAAVAPETILAFPEPAIMAQGIAIGILISATHGAIGLALGTLLRSAGAAIGAAFIWLIGSQILINSIATSLGGPFTALNHALPSASTTTLANIFGPVIGGAVTTPADPKIDPLVASWVLLAYLVALLTIGVLLVRRRDIN